jgi:hypothetical protein
VNGDNTAYTSTVNTAKHLLNIVQTNNEGIKLGGKEFSLDINAKLLSVVLSCSIVIARTGDLSAFGMGGKESEQCVDAASFCAQIVAT